MFITKSPAHIPIQYVSFSVEQTYAMLHMPAVGASICSHNRNRCSSPEPKTSNLYHTAAAAAAAAATDAVAAVPMAAYLEAS